MSGRAHQGQLRGQGGRYGHGYGSGAATRRGGWFARGGDAGASGTLLALQPGEQCVIGAIADDCARAQAVRFGIGNGALVSCVTKLPGGPVVLRAGRQEIAVGRGLASRIEVSAPGVQTVGQA